MTTATPTTKERQDRLLHHLTASGALTEPWRDAFTATPRHLFLPDLVWRHDTHGHTPIHRDTNPGAWWDLAYSDAPVVTQLDDGAAGGPGVATSSCSQPSVVARMLTALDLPDDGGARVLEIGTGTGFNAALLAHRLGDAAVTTVDIDPDLTQRARNALAAAGHRPSVVCADGMAGRPQGTPYDRVIATCSVARVPHAWVTQTRPGGRIVTPLHRDIWCGGLAVLTVDGTGQAAHGRWVGQAWFMPARADRLPPPEVDSATARSQVTDLAPARVTEPGFAAFAYARLPDITMAHTVDDDGVRVWLTGRDGSAATAVHGEQTEVWQYGPTDLWDRVHTAWEDYTAAGSPPLEAFGLTVTPDGQQVWLHRPENIIN